MLPGGVRSYLKARMGKHHRAFIGPTGEYDISAASQFNLLTLLGLREHHTLLDIGCGALRSGRLFIAYLQPDRYFGIEPNRWLLDAAIRHEVGRDLIAIKRPTFHHTETFQLGVFGRTFDFLLAHSIFTHASQDQIRTCLGEARKVMTPSSLFLATYAPGEASYEGDAWLYPEMCRYTAETMRALAEEQGLACEEIGWPHIRQRWVALSLPPA